VHLQLSPFPTIRASQPDGQEDVEDVDDTESENNVTIVVDMSHSLASSNARTSPRRSERAMIRPDYAKLHQWGFARVAQTKALDDEDPKSYEAAITSHNQRHWQQAMEEELSTHQEMRHES